MVRLLLLCLLGAWFTDSASSGLSEFSSEEKRWLSEHHVVRIRVPQYPPYLMYSPEAEGISIDYIRSISKLIGFEVRFVPAVTPWNQALADVAGPREHYDMLPTMQRSPERLRQFAMTKDYLSSPWVIVMRNNSPYYSGLDAMNGMSVAVEKGFYIEQLLKENYPKLEVRSFPSAKDALLAVSTVQADAYVGNLAVASYLMRANRLDNLSVMASTPFGMNTQAMAIRSDWAVLASLIDKGLDAMSFEEKAEIDRRWSVVEFRPTVDYTIAWQVLGAAAFLLLLAFLWNRRLAREIAFRKLQQAKIEQLAYFDTLTELPNRTRGQDSVEKALAIASRNGEGIAVLYIDINRFKLINDMYGQSVGDRLLREFAKRLQNCVRAQDTVCRLGGDTFMVVLTGSPSPQQVLLFCERTRIHVSLPYSLNSLQIRTEIRIGVALSTDDSRSAEALMRNADTALHRAKSLVTDGPVFFEQQMNDELMQFVEIRDALRHAIDHEEFVLHYQPQIELKTGRVIGMEALIRWRRDGAGLMPPGRFIHVAEQSGLIIAIGNWVLREACRQTALWRASGLGDLVVAVNVSALQLLDDGFKDAVIAILREFNLDPHCLELEITESVLVKDMPAIAQTIESWRQSGIRLSIDDFGTGYSNLAYLQQFSNIDKLKIDRSFTSQITSSRSSEAIVSAIIRIAHTLGFKVIAEGVEDDATLGRLREMGCDEVQGYLYAKPLPAIAFEDWIGRQDPAMKPIGMKPT